MRLRSLAALSAIAGMVLSLAGVVAASPPALADQSANLKYHCTYPLLGTSELDATVTTNIPSTIAPSTFTGPINISAVATIGADTTEGLSLLGVKSLVGTSKASAKVVSADAPIGITQALTFNPATISVPASGPFTVNAAGTYVGGGQGIQFVNTGWVHVYAGTLLLSITPQDANGQPTALGTFNVTCKLMAGQKNVIGKGLVTSGGTAPTDNLSDYYYDTTAGFTPANDTLMGDYAANPLKLDNGYTCQFPYIGNDSLGVHISSDIPATIPAGSAIPRINFSASADITANTNENGLQSLIPIDGSKVTAITGTAYADSQVSSNDVVDSTGAAKPVPVKLSMPVNFTNVPSTGGFTVTGINGSAPSLAFLKTGQGKVDVGNLTMNLTLHFDSPSQPTQDLGNVPCWKNTGTQGGAELWTTLGGLNVVNGPSQVAGLTATSTDGTNVTLKWNAATASTGASITGYDVFQDGKKVKNLTDTTYTVANGAGSVFAVRAVDSAGLDGPGSVEAAYIPSGTTANPTPLAAPTGVSSPSQTETSVDLAWTAVPNADSYDVYRDGAVVGNTKTASYTDTGLKASTTYHYQVVAKAASGSTTYSDSAKSAEFDQATKAPAGPTQLAAPTGLMSMGQTDTTIDLMWSAVANADSYDVYRDGALVGNTKTASYTDTGLKASTTYHYQVVAKAASGSTTYSDSAKSAEFDQATKAPAGPTPLAAPTGLKSTAQTDTTIALAWTGVANADSYDVYRDGAVVGNTKTASYTDTGLTAGTTYHYQVVAKAAAGSTTYSDSAKSSTLDASTVQATKNPPNPPTTVGSTLDASKTGITVTWSGATQGASPSNPIGGYNIYDKSGTLVKKVSDPSASSYDVTGLGAGDYQYSVTSFDTSGIESTTKATGPVVTVPTSTGTNTYSLSGSSTLKSVSADVPLAGTVSGPAPDSTGAFSADLTLNPTTTSFTLFGFIPTKASVTFAQQGKTTGKLAGGVLNTDTKTLVKIPSIKVFGVEIGSSSCATSTAADVQLKSTDFTVASGGTLSGTYTLPSLSGCGMLNSLISGLVAGPGNTVKLTATRTS